MSDCHFAFCPSVCATAGVRRTLSVATGVFFTGETGVTRETETGLLTSDAPPLEVRFRAAVLVPGGSALGSTVTLSERLPSGGIVPAGGSTVSHGSLAHALNPVSSALLPAMLPRVMVKVRTIGVFVPKGTTTVSSLPLPPRVWICGTTTTRMGAEEAPAPQLLSGVTR